MDYEKLKSYYNKVDKFSVTLRNEMNFDSLQEQLTKLAMNIEDLNRVIAELLVEQTQLERNVTEKKFEYELKFTQYSVDNLDVKKFQTAKERKDYINYFLMKDDYKYLVDKEQELRDVEKLLDLAKKKSRDLDRTYPKLKTLWESIQSESKYIKKIGSDAEYINRVKDQIDLDNSSHKPLFTDGSVEELISDQYDNNKKEENDIMSDFDTRSQKEVDQEVEDLLSDL
jgi:hypothetical protein